MPARYYVIKFPGSSVRNIDDEYIGVDGNPTIDIEEARIYERDAALATMASNPYQTGGAGGYAELVSIRPVEA